MFAEENKIFIMFFNGDSIEIFTTTLSAEMLKPTNLSALFLAYTGISKT